MGTITIFPETTKKPITLIGHRAGVCWGADVSDDEKNYRRGLDCIQSGHGRTVEYPNIEMVIDGYSARVIREWYTHVGGAPSRLQASTRYINYENFKYVTPHSIERNEKANAIYDSIMKAISDGCKQLGQEGIPGEDISMTLPLAMETKIVDKRNLRNLIDMSRQRMCSRAYWEYRELFADICTALKAYSDEWAYVVDTQMMPKCEALGYCTEKKSCERMPKR